MRKVIHPREVNGWVRTVFCAQKQGPPSRSSGERLHALETCRARWPPTTCTLYFCEVRFYSGASPTSAAPPPSTSSPTKQNSTRRFCLSLSQSRWPHARCAVPLHRVASLDYWRRAPRGWRSRGGEGTGGGTTGFSASRRWRVWD